MTSWKSELDSIEKYRNDMLLLTNQVREQWWGTDKYNLTFDDRLTLKAQKYAEFLANDLGYMTHGDYFESIGQNLTQEDLLKPEYANLKMEIGQNIAQHSCTGASCNNPRIIMGSPSFAIDGWLVECHNCNDENQCATSANKKQVGHFTQLIWKSCTKLGVGRAVRLVGNTKQVFVVCNYSPAGNRKINKTTWSDNTMVPSNKKIKETRFTITDCFKTQKI